MASDLPNSPQRGCRSFQKIVDAFLAGEGLPFSEILSADRIHRVFARHDSLFGVGQIYSTAVVLWSFLSQVLRDKKEASCHAPSARIRARRPANPRCCVRCSRTCRRVMSPSWTGITVRS